VEEIARLDQEAGMNALKARQVLDATIGDIAQVLGGIFALHDVEDAVVWKAMKHLDLSHSTALARLQESDGPESFEDREASKTHPAVEALLRKLRVKRDD